jgi:hypothetical protein
MPAFYPPCSTIRCLKYTCYGEDVRISTRGNDGSDDFLLLHCSYLRLTATRPFGIRHLIGFLAYSSARQDVHRLDQSLCVSLFSWTLDLSRVSAPSRARQDLYRLKQAFLVLVQLDAGPLESWLLAHQLLKLSRGELGHEDRREEFERALRALKKEMKCSLSAHVVDKGLETDLVVRLQNVVDLLHDVFIVAHGASNLSREVERHNHDTAGV